MRIPFLFLSLLACTPGLSASLVPSEIMYHPQDSDDYEYIEFFNAGTSAIPLEGYQLVEGITFSFPNISLEPGKFLIIVRNPTFFTAKYQIPESPYYTPDLFIAGTWEGGLKNSGENLELRDATGAVIYSFTYDDEEEFGWPKKPDGEGSSLELKKPFEFAELTDASERKKYLEKPENWRSSAAFQGNPGSLGSAAEDTVIINEILANTDSELTDSVELHNPTEATIDISGWFISDSTNNYEKYQIPPNTQLAPGQYIVFNETHFNPEGEWKNGLAANPGPNDFSFSGNKGDEVYLTISNQQGLITGIADSVEFGPTLSGESLGRWPNAKGEFIAMDSFTPAAPNSGPRIGPILISEIMYHPNLLEEDFFEYIEIYNAGEAAQDLSLWTLEDGVEYIFPNGTIIQQGEYILVTGLDPVSTELITNFRNYYRIDQSLQILGPWAGSLNNSEDHIKLYRRDVEGDFLTDPDTLEVSQPLVLEDEVAYQDSGDWPGRADGTGPSLSRKSYSNLGNDPGSWRSSNEFNGNPGETSLPQRFVAITEVLTHTDPPLLDTIELHNTTDSAIHISGWYLSDTKEDEEVIEEFRKFRIPDNTILEAGGYIAFDQSQFNPNIDPETGLGTPEPHHFGLASAYEEDIALVSADEEGNLLRIVDHVEVGPTANGISFGLWPDVESRFYPMAQRTLGAPNSTPKVGPLVISEIMYNPGEQVNASELEFIEIYNIGAETIQLGNDSDTGGIWELDGGVDYPFPLSATISPGHTLLVVGFDPSDAVKLEAFKQHYSLGNTPAMVGPWSGSLSNGGERVSILRPDTLQETRDGLSTFHPLTEVESISFNDSSTWPQSADGLGASLQRVVLSTWGDTSDNWQASDPAPTPGSVVQVQDDPPVITSSPITVAFEGEYYSYLITSTDADSPTPPTLTLTPDTGWWRFEDLGNGTGLLSGIPSSQDVDFYILTATAMSDGESVDQQFPIQVYSAQFDLDQDGVPDGIEVRLGSNRADPNSTPGTLSMASTSLTNTGWLESTWFGIYMDEFDGWIYHLSLGWLFMDPATSDGHWFWDEQLGWIWTREDVFPKFYDPTQGWLYYFPDSQSPRFFYNYQNETWDDY